MKLDLWNLKKNSILFGKLKLSLYTNVIICLAIVREEDEEDFFVITPRFIYFRFG